MGLAALPRSHPYSRPDHRATIAISAASRPQPPRAGSGAAIAHRARTPSRSAPSEFGVRIRISERRGFSVASSRLAAGNPGRANEEATIMPLSIAEMSLVEQRVSNDGANAGLAYLLWFFLWFVSAHRFYLGRPGSAILQILSYFIMIGFIWALIDAFLMPGMIREKNDQIRHRMMSELSGRSG
jgi:TM2 domain-containing membrane protein YozV